MRWTGDSFGDDGLRYRDEIVIDANKKSYESNLDGYVLDSSPVYVPCPAVDEDALAVRVVGDSMSPLFDDGDVAVFVSGRQPQSGAAVLVALGSSPCRVFGLYYRETDDIVRLQPANTVYPAVCVAVNDIIAVMTVVYRIISFE